MEARSRASDGKSKKTMALGSDTIDLLIRLRAAGCIPAEPAVVEIGAQQLGDGLLAARAELENLGGIFGAAGACPLPPPLPTSAGIAHGELKKLDPAAPMARDFWTWLGFQYAAIDIDGSPGSIPLDLNFDAVPDDAAGKFDLVTNFGTTEHVANQLNAFKVVHDLAALGGVMLHHLPAQGMLNHGLINYNPKFFWMLARSNGYKWLYADFTWAPTSYELPRNIIEHMTPFAPDIAARLRDYRTADCGIVVALQKVFDIPFVPPLDVNTGTRTDNPALARRYWTVFTPHAFATRRAGAWWRDKLGLGRRRGGS